MSSIFELKEKAVTETPLLVFDCAFPDGRLERWSTHCITVDEDSYDARVLQHNLFEIQTASDQGVDGIPRISLLLANTDSRFSEIERTCGWKGAQLTAAFLFQDLRNKQPASDRMVVFRGLCNPPEEIREATFRISATNKMNLQRVLLPQLRIQRRCPWTFPSTQEQRTEALSGGVAGKYSRFYRCGYSADLPGGTGSLNGAVPFTTCGYTRSDCETRTMFRRFGGIEFVPPAIAVRSFGEKNWHQSALVVNQTRYNDFAPLVYGTAWYAPPVVFARNDGNLTRMEVLLGMGEVQGVLKVLVNDVELPLGVSGANMTGTGWYNLLTTGTRDGVRNADFTNSSGELAGDPYGSMAYLSIAVPNGLADGTSLPHVKVLAQGLKLPGFEVDGTPTGETFSANPAWILLDILRRSGWNEDELELSSFARGAAYCDEPLPALDIYGTPISLPRFSCNLVLQSRRSAADVVRGVRNCARLLLTYGDSGKLSLRLEGAMALEQASKPEGSNSREALNGGWPSYEFGDGSNGYTGILRRSDGEPHFRLFSRSMADAPNRYTVEFQDALNEYQQDSFSLMDVDDVGRSGQEIAAPLMALGIPNFNQAARLLKLALDKSVRGNTYAEFATSVKCLNIMPGDLITITYLKEGFDRQPFRVLKLAPGANYRTTVITAQIHDDEWYEDSNGQAESATGSRRQQGAGIGVPKPLVGSVIDEGGANQLGVEEILEPNSDGSIGVSVSASFVPPRTPGTAAPPIPLVSLAAELAADGSLAGNQCLYYAISACDDLGSESALSFIVRAWIPVDGGSVTIRGLSFGPRTATFSVYRGDTPAQMFRIATGLPPACEFTDPGLPKELISPPDANFDHGNFYWRLELVPESQATIHTSTAIGNTDLQMPANRFRGMIARIMRGRGHGQERLITSNTASLLTVAPAFDTIPDGSSSFAVAENTWRFASLAKSSPALLTIPNRAGETVQLTGRAANVNDVECSDSLSIVTRWQIGGAVEDDTTVPTPPFFGLQPLPRGGGVELSGVSFGDLHNTHSIIAATLLLFYWDELAGQPNHILSAAVDDSETTITPAPPWSASPGDYIQVEREVLQIEGIENNGATYHVIRGKHSSLATSHPAGSKIYCLQQLSAIAPFPPGFFGSPYGGSWSFPVVLPNARVASAALYVTNGKGDSPSAFINLTDNDDMGMRTLSGGQYSIQVSGYLSVDQSAAPALLIESPHAVREVYAVLGTPADRDVRLMLNLNGIPYCEIVVPSGLTRSYGVDGNTLAPLLSGSELSLSILQVGLTTPGADLTVLIRL